jgi:hypothetical protein
MFQSLVKPICTEGSFNNEINPNNTEEDDSFEDYINKCMPNIYIYIYIYVCLIHHVWTLTFQSKDGV